MILRIVLFLTSGILVSSNNGYSIIPAQTYPSYIQNDYANPSANQPIDIISYLQDMMVQNESPSLNLSPSNIRQILLNRILSNQQTQSNFDQNSRAYGSNYVELPNNSFAPNAVNSYSVAPMVNEFVNYQQTGVNKEDKAVEIETEEKRKKTKKRKSKSRRKHDGSEKNHNSTRKNNEKVNDLQDNDRETSKKSKKRSRKPKTDASSHDNHTNNENNNNTKKKKRKNKEIEVKDPVDEDDKFENPKPRRRHKKKQKSDKENAEKLVSDEATTLKSTQIQEGINVVDFNEGIVEENRIPRNPIPEGNDLFKSIPNLPENFANSFHFNGMSQFNNNPAMSNFFANYENIYKAMMAKNKGTNEQKEIKRRRPQKSRNNIKKKIEVRKKNSTATEATVSKSPKPVVTPKVNVVTTEKTIFINEETRTNVDPNPKEENLKSDEKPTEMKETLPEIENEEVKDMESNIDDPVSYYGYIDYYPQFTDSAAYTANNREVYIKNLGDTKYYYAVDKENPELIKRMRFEGFGLPERIVKDYEVNKKYDDAEKEGKKNSLKSNFKETKEDVIQFRSAPQLEIPDFQTRKVEKSEINPESRHYFDENDDYDARFFGDKSSIYSEAKLPYHAGTKEKSKKILKDTRKDVETVFARSKVANYGPVYKPEEDSASVATSNQDLTDDSSFKDGGTTYILATSLDYPESFW